jgi:hypothetical protein
MATELLMDNWTFQNAGELLHGEISDDLTKEIRCSVDGQQFQYVDVPQIAIQLESLFQVLHNIVLDDTCLVDEQAVNAWVGFPRMAILRQERLVATKPFEQTQGEWKPLREEIEHQLCFCPDLVRLHRENVEEYARSHSAKDPLLSQVLWGGAGMLARAWHARVPFVLHPLREQLFKQAKFLPRPSAWKELQNFVDFERLKIIERADSQGYFGCVDLPPVALQVIANSKRIDDVIPAAIRLRDSYAELRRWLEEMQQLLDVEDIPEIAKRKSLFEKVAKGIASACGQSQPGNSGIEFGIIGIKIKTAIPQFADRLRNCFGVRSQISKLIDSPAGITGINQLVKMLGYEQKAKGLSIRHALLSRKIDSPFERERRPPMLE